jgi:hypothetical protein
MLHIIILRFICWFFASKGIVMSSNKGYVMHAVQIIQHYNVFTSSLHIFMSHTVIVCVPCYLLQHHQCCMLLFSLIAFMLLCVVVTVSYCCAQRTTSTTYCCLISVIVINSYKITLYVWYLAYHICMQQ